MTTLGGVSGYVASKPTTKDRFGWFGIWIVASVFGVAGLPRSSVVGVVVVVVELEVGLGLGLDVDVVVGVLVVAVTMAVSGPKMAFMAAISSASSVFSRASEPRIVHWEFSWSVIILRRLTVELYGFVGSRVVEVRLWEIEDTAWGC